MTHAARAECHVYLGAAATLAGDDRAAARQYMLAHIANNLDLAAWDALREALVRCGASAEAAEMTWAFAGIPPRVRVEFLPEREWACVERTTLAAAGIVFSNARTVAWAAPLGVAPFNYCIQERLESSAQTHDLEVFEVADAKALYRQGSIHVLSADRIVSPFATGDLTVATLEQLEPLRLPGTCCFLGDYFWSSNYAHWLLDWLPRLHVYQATASSSIDYYYVATPLQPYQREHLEKLGITEDQVVSATTAPCIQADRLLFSMTCLMQNHPAQMAAPWALAFLQESFLTSGPAAPHRRLFLSRKDSASRQLEGEDAIAMHLEERFGFERIRLSDVSALEQARLFHEAEAVVAPHGAGLANLAFCQPGTAVLELFSPLYGTPAFFQVAQGVGARYFCLNGDDELRVAPEVLRNFRSPYGGRNIRIDPERIYGVVGTMLGRSG